MRSLLCALVGVSVAGFHALVVPPTNTAAARSQLKRVQKQSWRMSATAVEESAPTIVPQSTPATPYFERDAWERLFERAREEGFGELAVLEGEVPKDLVGTVFRNGPSNFQAGNDRFKHIFDGDGMIAAVTFREGRAFYRNRFVRTAGMEREQREKRQVYRGFSNREGGILKNALDITQKNVANTNVLMWGKELLALWEAGPPHRLNPDNLDTLGLADFKGAVTADDKFSAHPKVDYQRNRLVNFGSDGFKLTLQEFDSEGRQLSKREQTFGGQMIFMHDFAITDNWAIFFKSPVKFRALSWILGATSLASSLQWDPTTESEVVLIPRHNPAMPAVIIKAPPRFSFHMVNAFEDPSGNKVTFDMMEADSLDLWSGAGKRPLWEDIVFEQVPKQRLQRYEVDVAKRTVTTDCVSNNYLDMVHVAPWVTSKPYRYAYCLCTASGEPGPLQGIVKVDVVAKTEERWLPEPHQFFSEPAFAPRALGTASSGASSPSPRAEDDGYLVAFLFDGRSCTSQLCIFDAAKVSAGPVCRLNVGSNVPFGLHGNFVPGYAPSLERLSESCKALQEAPVKRAPGRGEGGEVSIFLSQIFKR